MENRRDSSFRYRTRNNVRLNTFLLVTDGEMTMALLLCSANREFALAWNTACPVYPDVVSVLDNVFTVVVVAGMMVPFSVKSMVVSNATPSGTFTLNTAW